MSIIQKSKCLTELPPNKVFRFRKQVKSKYHKVIVTDEANLSSVFDMYKTMTIVVVDNMDVNQLKKEIHRLMEELKKKCNNKKLIIIYTAGFCCLLMRLSCYTKIKPLKCCSKCELYLKRYGKVDLFSAMLAIKDVILSHVADSYFMPASLPPFSIKWHLIQFQADHQKCCPHSKDDNFLYPITNEMIGEMQKNLDRELLIYNQAVNSYCRDANLPIIDWTKTYLTNTDLKERQVNIVTKINSVLCDLIHGIYEQECQLELENIQDGMNSEEIIVKMEPSESCGNPASPAVYGSAEDDSLSVEVNLSEGETSSTERNSNVNMNFSLVVSNSVVENSDKVTTAIVKNVKTDKNLVPDNSLASDVSKNVDLNEDNLSNSGKNSEIMSMRCKTSLVDCEKNICQSRRQKSKRLTNFITEEISTSSASSEDIHPANVDTTLATQCNSSNRLKGISKESANLQRPLELILDSPELTSSLEGNISLSGESISNRCDIQSLDASSSNDRFSFEKSNTILQNINPNSCSSDNLLQVDTILPCHADSVIILDVLERNNLSNVNSNKSSKEYNKKMRQVEDIECIESSKDEVSIIDQQFLINKEEGSEKFQNSKKRKPSSDIQILESVGPSHSQNDVIYISNNKKKSALSNEIQKKISEISVQKQMPHSRKKVPILNLSSDLILLQEKKASQMSIRHRNTSAVRCGFKRKNCMPSSNSVSDDLLDTASNTTDFSNNDHQKLDIIEDQVIEKKPENNVIPHNVVDSDQSDTQEFTMHKVLCVNNDQPSSQYQATMSPVPSNGTVPGSHCIMKIVPKIEMDSDNNEAVPTTVGKMQQGGQLKLLSESPTQSQRRNCFRRNPSSADLQNKFQEPDFTEVSVSLFKRTSVVGSTLRAIITDQRLKNLPQILSGDRGYDNCLHICSDNAAIPLLNNAVREAILDTKKLSMNQRKTLLVAVCLGTVDIISLLTSNKRVTGHARRQQRLMYTAQEVVDIVFKRLRLLKRSICEVDQSARVILFKLPSTNMGGNVEAVISHLNNKIRLYNRMDSSLNACTNLNCSALRKVDSLDFVLNAESTQQWLEICKYVFYALEKEIKQSYGKKSTNATADAALVTVAADDNDTAICASSTSSSVASSFAAADAASSVAAAASSAAVADGAAATTSFISSACSPFIVSSTSTAVVASCLASTTSTFVSAPTNALSATSVAPAAAASTSDVSTIYIDVSTSASVIAPVTSASAADTPLNAHECSTKQVNVDTKCEQNVIKKRKLRTITDDDILEIQEIQKEGCSKIRISSRKNAFINERPNITCLSPVQSVPEEAMASSQFPRRCVFRNRRTIEPLSCSPEHSTSSSVPPCNDPVINAHLSEYTLLLRGENDESQEVTSRTCLSTSVCILAAVARFTGSSVKNEATLLDIASRLLQHERVNPSSGSPVLENCEVLCIINAVSEALDYLDSDAVVSQRANDAVYAAVLTVKKVYAA